MFSHHHCISSLLPSKDCTLNNSALSKFSNKFIEKYIQICYNTLLSYNKLSDIEKKKLIIKAWKTWDNYSLSIIYIKLFTALIKNDNTNFKNTFIKDFFQILIQNIHPNFNKRNSVEKTILNINKIVGLNKNNIDIISTLSKNINKNKNILIDLKLHKKETSILSESLLN